MFSQTVELTHPNLLVNEILSPLNPLVIGRHGKENVWKSRLIKKKIWNIYTVKNIMPGKLYTYSSYIDLFMYSLAPTIKTLIICWLLFLLASNYFDILLFSKLTKAATSFEKKMFLKLWKKHTEKRWLILVGRIIILFYLCTWVIIHYVLSIIIFSPLKMICRFLCNGETGRKLVKTWSKVMVY